MKPIKGLHLDSRPEDQPEGSYPFGMNGLQFDLKGAVLNEPGFKKLSHSIPLGYSINGLIPTDTNEVIVFFTDNTNSCIRLVNVLNDVVTFDFSDQVKTYKLGFKADNYITGTTQRNYLGELVCAFTDKVTFPKYLNFAKPSTDYLKDWNLFPECKFPTLTKTLEVGGYTKVGSYFFAVRYWKQDGTRTSFSGVSSGVAITSEDNDLYSDTAIRLTITNQDLAYDFLEVAIISRVSGVTTAGLLKKIPILPGTSTVNFTGEEVLEDVSLEEILVPQPSYDRVGSIAQLNDALYLAKLEKTNAVLDMQPYANMVKLLFKSELIDVENCPDEHKAGIKKSLMHQEVYAAYIQYELAEGKTSISYTIPGPAPDPADLLSSSVALAGGFAAPAYKVEDCIHTFSSTSLSGIPGTYLNDTEVYPIDDNFDSTAVGGDDLRNQPVRHHKMPSLKWCKENLYSTEADYGTKKLDLLGLQAFNIVIPPKYQDVIVGYRILLAKRTTQNMTVIGESILLHASNLANSFNVPIDPTTMYSSGHNWKITGYYPDQNSFRFHAFDILFNRPGIKPAYIAAQYKLDTPVTPKYLSWSYPTAGNPLDSYGNCVNMVDNTTGVSSNSPANNLRSITESKYLENNVTVGNYTNQYLEKVFAGRLGGSQIPLGITAQDLSGQGDFSVGSTAQSYLTTLCDLKTNVYENFYNQELFALGDPVPITSNPVFWGGDIFLCAYTFHTYGVMDTAWASPYSNSVNSADPDMRGRRVINRVICETVANLYARFEIPGNIYSKWHPHNPVPNFGFSSNWDLVYPVKYSGYTDPNQFGYTKGSEAINDLISDDIYNPYREYQTKFPYRIQRGGKLSRTNNRSWKTFLALDYYDMQKNMGFIEHLEGMDDRLLIHCENALFITQDKTKLETGVLSVTLGTGDIFQFEPQEVASSKLGYAGTQNDLACIRTPIGYVFPDAKQGELYLYKGKELKLLNEGLNRFLREYLKVFGKNPYTGNGITLGWDQKYKRILATVKNIRPANQTKPVVVINSTADIKQVISQPPVDDILVTTNGNVAPGEYVFMNGRFLQYFGINNSTVGANSPYACPPDAVVCNPPTNISVSQVTNCPKFAHIEWDYTGLPLSFNIYRIDQSQLVPIASGTTSAGFLDLDAGVLQWDNTIYFFVLRTVCGDSTSTDVVVSFSVTQCEENPVLPCTPGDSFTAIIDSSSNPVWTGSGENILFKVKTNGAAAYYTDSTCFKGSNPSIPLNNPTFGACFDIYFGKQNGAWSPGQFFDESADVANIPNRAIQHVAVTCVHNNTPSGYPGIYTIDLIPDVSTAYTGIDMLGNPKQGYMRWYLDSPQAWLGGDSTTFVDPVYGPVGPNPNTRFVIYE
jgi:hypothetical protein